MKKCLKTFLGLLLSVALIFSGVSVVSPVKVSAKEMPSYNAYMWFQRTQFETTVIYEKKPTVGTKKMKGVSYNESTNILTLSNVNVPQHELLLFGMGDLTIVLKGNNRIKDIDAIFGDPAQKISLTFKGTGKLTCNSKYQGDKRLLHQKRQDRIRFLERC